MPPIIAPAVVALAVAGGLTLAGEAVAPPAVGSSPVEQPFRTPTASTTKAISALSVECLRFSTNADVFRAEAYIRSDQVCSTWQPVQER
jgi:hypothetical protein